MRKCANGSQIEAKSRIRITRWGKILIRICPHRVIVTGERDDTPSLSARSAPPSPISYTRRAPPCTPLTMYKVQSAWAAREARRIPGRLPRRLYNIICANRLPPKNHRIIGVRREAGGAFWSGVHSKEEASDLFFLISKIARFRSSQKMTRK